MIQVIERFHRILEYVAPHPEKLHTLGELSECINVSTSTCANIVKTMVALNYLRQNYDRKGYMLGFAPYLLTSYSPFKQHLVNTARPLLEDLVKEINEMVVLVAESGGKRVELLRLEGNSLIQLRLASRPNLNNLFISATGAIILAYMPEIRLKTLWDEGHDENIMHVNDFDALLIKCNEIRKNGEFISEPTELASTDLMNAFSTISFPIYEGNNVTSALGVRVPAYRLIGEHRQKIIRRCRAVAGLISKRMGMTEK